MGGVGGGGEFIRYAIICMFPNNILIGVFLKYWPQLARNKSPSHLLENELNLFKSQSELAWNLVPIPFEA